MAFFLIVVSQPLLAQTDTDPFPDVNYHKYQSNMSFTGQVRIDGEVQPDGTIVAVYCGDEIRGKDVVFSQGSRSNFFMVNAMGEKSGEPLHFKVYVNGRIIEVDQGVTFSGDAELGSIKNYYYIDLPAPVNTTFSVEGWATTCLPFNAEVPEGITVWNATGIADGELVMEICEGSVLPKDTPVLLQSEGGANCEWLARVTDGNVNASGSIFCGTTKPTTVDAGSILTLGHSEDTGEIGFWRFIGTTVPANRAYIDDVPSEARGVRIRIDNDDTTEIDDVIANPSPSLSIWYSIDGQRLSCKPSQNGIYVLSNSDSLQGKNNGRKVLIKK